FTNPDSTLLTKAGHHKLCHYIALTDAFPLPIDKEEVSWKCLVKGAHRNEEMINKLEALEANSTLKSRVIDYVWGAGSQLRGELIYKARVAVPSAYSLPGSVTEEELRKALNWLIQRMQLTHPDINAKVCWPVLYSFAQLTSLKACTCSEDKPWQHPIFPHLIKTQWWGRKGEAKKLGNKEDSNPFINTPITLMALVATAVRPFLVGLNIF
ncbi:hypothetical protein SCLCIDRAFT_134495, partial [Scleroderma citrinum Foug A]